MFKKGLHLLIILLAVSILILGCNTAKVDVEKGDKQDITTPDSTLEEEQQLEEITPVDLREIRANELGDIMVLMYHSIGEPEAEWRRTPENFRADLEYLYQSGYRPISLTDYVTGNITTEAGFTPIVLTFDDGW